MPPLELLGIFVACLVIGGVSAIMGLGGGLFIVPLVSLLPGVELRDAAGVGLVCTLATSASGSVALDKARLANLALVAHLELAAAIGAVLSASFLAAVLPERVVAGTFTVVVAYAAWRMVGRARRSSSPVLTEPDPRDLRPVHYPWGMLGCGGAGVLSGVLGIGGGPVKVPVQTEIMRVPIRVALANSNLMVGITAGAGATVYYLNGWIPAGLIGPSVLGIVVGAYAGGRIAPRLNTRRLTAGFTVILIIVAGRMLWKALAPAA